MRLSSTSLAYQVTFPQIPTTSQLECLSIQLNQSIFPSVWSLTLPSPQKFPFWVEKFHFIRIPKTSTPSSSPYRCCPISLLSLISKVLEQHVFDIIIDITSKDNVISPDQFRFFYCDTHISSTVLVTVLVSFNTRISSTVLVFNTLDTKKSVCTAFLGLTKAVDFVPHVPLLCTLSKLNLPSHFCAASVVTYHIILNRYQCLVEFLLYCSSCLLWSTSRLNSWPTSSGRIWITSLSFPEYAYLLQLSYFTLMTSSSITHCLSSLSYPGPVRLYACNAIMALLEIS